MIPALPEDARRVIVGGGIAGVALAAHLARLGDGDVLVLERGERLGEGATGRSAGGIRQQFADPVCVAAARETVRLLGGFAAETGVDPEFRRHGYLLLATEPRRADALRAEAAAQRAAGLAVETLDAAATAARFPSLSVDDVLAANFCGSDGYLSPHALVEGYRRTAAAAGVRFATGVEVTGLLVEGRRVTGVRTSAGALRAGDVVVAAGAEAGPLLGGAGVVLPLRPTLRRIFATHPLPDLPVDLPLVLDLDRPFYFRPESGGAILSLAEVEEGGAPETVEEGDGAMPDRLVERAVRRAPVLGAARFLRAWSGHRTLTPDDRPILGPVPGLPGLWLAVGFGGHGITHAPSLCMALAAAMTAGDPAVGALAPFAPDRPGLRGPDRAAGVI